MDGGGGGGKNRRNGVSRLINYSWEATLLHLFNIYYFCWLLNRVHFSPVLGGEWGPRHRARGMMITSQLCRVYKFNLNYGTTYNKNKATSGTRNHLRLQMYATYAKNGCCSDGGKWGGWWQRASSTVVPYQCSGETATKDKEPVSTYQPTLSHRS